MEAILEQKLGYEHIVRNTYLHTHTDTLISIYNSCAHLSSYNITGSRTQAENILRALGYL